MSTFRLSPHISRRFSILVMFSSDTDTSVSKVTTASRLLRPDASDAVCGLSDTLSRLLPSISTSDRHDKGSNEMDQQEQMWEQSLSLCIHSVILNIYFLTNSNRKCILL